MGKEYHYYTIRSSKEVVSDVKIDSANGTPVFFFDERVHKEDNPEIELSDAELIDKAKDFLASFLPSSQLSSYTFSVSPITGTYTMVCGQLSFGGVSTSETVRVFIHRCGLVYGYGGYSYDYYSDCGKYLTSSLIQNGEAKIIEEIAQYGLTENDIEKYQIKTDAFGCVYLIASFKSSSKHSGVALCYRLLDVE